MTSEEIEVLAHAAVAGRGLADMVIRHAPASEEAQAAAAILKLPIPRPETYLAALRHERRLIEAAAAEVAPDER